MDEQMNIMREKSEDNNKKLNEQIQKLKSKHGE
jgi:hypothetical protein